MEQKTCENCKAECCKYVVVELPFPESLEDFEEIKWLISHENVNVFIESDGTWNVEFVTKCKFLGENNKCINYEKRSDVCKEYSQEGCHFYNGNSEIMVFKNPEDVNEYVDKILLKGLHKKIISETTEEDG